MADPVELEGLAGRLRELSIADKLELAAGLYRGGSEVIAARVVDLARDEMTIEAVRVLAAKRRGG